ncbi:MAG: ribonuclease H-like domain-containing protein [Cocleimonas sp.]|nr:ribonuclease H-like domain-containing protein [Cocleimonas sp.]
MSILAYSLITIPDFSTGSKLHDLQGLDDKGTAKALFHLQAQQSGDECLPSYLQQIVAISMVLLDHDEKVQTVTLKDDQEVDSLNTFFDIIESYKPTIVTWDGEYFNAEVIGYRSIKHAIQMSPHYENKDNHFNLNDAMVSSSAVTPLDDIATLLGLDVQENKNSREICESYLASEQDDLYGYCESNALNIYQIYLRYQLSHGEINEENYLRLIKE